MSGLLDEWRRRLSEARYPVLEACAGTLGSLPANARNQRLAQVFAHDPLLTAQVIRKVNACGRTHIQALEQAPALLGPDYFRELAHSAPRVEKKLQGAAYFAYVQTLKRTYAAASLAAYWAQEKGYGHPQEFFYSTLLYPVAELAIRVLDPKLGYSIDQQGGDGWSAPQQALLQGSVGELALVVARDWDLPELLLDALAGRGGSQGKVGLVTGAHRLLDVCADNGPDSPEATTVMETIREGLGTDLDGMRRMVFIVARDAARDFAAWFRDEPGRDQVELYPRRYRWAEGVENEESRPAPRAQRPTDPGTGAGVTPGITAEPRARKGDHRNPEVKPVTSMPPGNPEKPVVTRKPAGESLLSRAVSAAAGQLKNKAGLERVVFALLSRDQKSLQALYSLGVEEGNPLRGFKVENSPGCLLSRLLARQQVLWLNDGNRQRLASLLKGPVTPLFGNREVLMASVLVKGRPVGILYADAGDSSPSPRQVQAFKAVTLALCNTLEAAADTTRRKAG